jgi:hypothetical protein
MRVREKRESKKGEVSGGKDRKNVQIFIQNKITFLYILVLELMAFVDKTRSGLYVKSVVTLL